MTPSDYTRSRARTDTETLVQMYPELRARAFAVQGIDDYTQLKRVQDAVAKLPEGGDWKTLQREIAAELGSDTQATRKRAETVLRTNGFQAYAAARYRKQQAGKDIFPYWKYVTMDDGRVRDRRGRRLVHRRRSRGREGGAAHPGQPDRQPRDRRRRGVRR